MHFQRDIVAERKYMNSFIVFASFIAVALTIFLGATLLNRFNVKHEIAVLQRLSHGPVRVFDLQDHVGDGYNKGYHYQRMCGLEERGLVTVTLAPEAIYVLTASGEDYLKRQRESRA